MNIVFLCTGNSCRSILAEATFNHLAPSDMKAFSAGSAPTGEIHPRSLSLLKEKNIATDGYYSKSWHALTVVPDIVITVCGHAAGETCPAYLGQAVRAHWGVDDPAKATGREEDIQASFEKAYQTLRKRIEAFLALGNYELNADLQRRLDEIGQLE